MLTVRCDSCGENVTGNWYEPTFIGHSVDAQGRTWQTIFQQPTPKWKERGYSMCEDCCEAFVTGKLHADATIDHSKL